MKTFITVIILVVLGLVGCSNSRPSVAQPSAIVATGLPNLPIIVKLKQRTTQEIPGNNAQLRLTIDDITRGQVMVSMSTATGLGVLGPISMKTGDQQRFTLREQYYDLRLKELQNELIGEDTAQFEITKGNAEISESEKIERLLTAIASQAKAIFIRNGTEHSAQEAADHLHRKWKSQANEIKTAQQFIDYLATTSSTSGQPYVIRFPDGKTVTAREFLTQQLAEISKTNMK